MMKKSIFYLCLVVVIPIQLNAQISTSIAEKYSHWMVVKTMRCTYMAHGTSGSARTWDFSGLTPVNANDTSKVQYILRDATMPFPNASIVLKKGSNYTFFEYTSNGVYELGSLDSSSNPPDTVVYSNTKKIMQHPITYTQMFTDSFALSNGVDSGVGVITDTVESYGKLILPYDTFENVIRMVITEVIDGTISGMPVTARRVSYRWYDNSHRAALLRLDSIDIGGAKSQEAYYLLEEDPVLISDVAITPLAIRAALSGNSIVLAEGTFNNHTYKLALYHINGQKVYTASFAGGGRNVFDTKQELSPGMYLLTVMDKERHGTAGITKLVKQ